MSRERVTLIATPSPFLADERVFPQLGILKVASALEAREVPVDVLDLTGVKNYPEALSAYLDLNRSRLYGVTATTPQYPDAVKIARLIRAAGDNKVILGGAHPTMVYSAATGENNSPGRGSRALDGMLQEFHTIVAGDGEEAVFPAFWGAGERVIDAGSRLSPYFLQKGALENYSYPARHLIDLQSYKYSVDGLPATSLICQLGCPFECGFCGGRSTPAYRVARRRPVDSVIGEVDEIVKKYDRRGLMFYDDELNIHNETLMELLEGLVVYQEQNSVQLALRGFVRADLFTLDQAKMMYRAGFRWLLSGVESGDPTMLEAMNKKTTPEVNTRWVELSRKAGLKTKALMSLGHPGENQKTILNSLAWVLDTRPDEVDWTIITQYPGSPYFDNSRPLEGQPGTWVYTEPKTGLPLYSREADYTTEAEYYKGIPGDYTSYVWTDYLTPEALVFYRDFAERSSRLSLGLPPITITPALSYEHSMGQGINTLLRFSK